MEDIVRVIRIIEYVGPREWMDLTLAKSFARPGNVSQKMLGAPRQIRLVAESAPEPWTAFEYTPLDPEEADRG
jgi:hypothetical protein